MSKIVKVPALDKQIFGRICEHTSLDEFTSRGHKPVQVKMKDHRFVVFLRNQWQQTELPRNFNSFGKHPVVTSKIEHQCKVTLSLVDFETNDTTVDGLYEDLLQQMKNHIQAIGGTFRSKFSDVFSRRLEEDVLFAVQYWVTRKVDTGETCLWEWRPVAGTDGKQELKLVLTEIDGEKAEKFTVRTLRTVAAGMWEDECETFNGGVIRETTMCAGLAEKKGILIKMPKGAK